MVETRSQKKPKRSRVAEVVKRAKGRAKRGFVTLATQGGRSRCPSSHPVDCNLVDGHLAPQRERCVKDEAHCRTPHDVLPGKYAKQGKWSATAAEREAAARRKRVVGAARSAVAATGAAAIGVAKTTGAAAHTAGDLLKGGARATWRFQERSAKRAKFGWSRFKELLHHADETLPDESAGVWKDPRQATLLLQQYLLRYWSLDTKAVSDSLPIEPVQPRVKTLDKWQEAVEVPALRVKELLVSATAGTVISHQSSVISNQ